MRRSRPHPRGSSVLAVGILTLAAGGMAAVLAGCGDDAETGPATPPAEFLEAQNLSGRACLLQFGSIRGRLSQQNLARLVELHAAGATPDLAFIRVEMTPDADAVEAYYSPPNKPPFPIYHDADASVARGFGVSVHPQAVLVDRFGHVRYRGPMQDEVTLFDWYNALVAEATDPGPEAPTFGLSVETAGRLLAATRLPTLEGQPAALDEALLPGGMLAVFVDTQCPFSGEAVGDIRKVVAGLAEHDISTVLINVGDPEEEVRPFYAGKDPGVPVLFDTSNATEKAWHVDKVPKACYFTGEGTLLYRGKALWDNVAAAAEEAHGLEPGAIQFPVKGTEFG